MTVLAGESKAYVDYSCFLSYVVQFYSNAYFTFRIEDIKYTYLKLSLLFSFYQ